MMVTFIIGLVLSGVTAFPLLGEMKLLVHFLGLDGAVSPAGYSGLDYWILTVRFGLEDMYGRYPWIAYGTDWLAFGHIIIALFFIAPLRRPWEARPVLQVGIVACVGVIPLALVCGGIRGIPPYWRAIDCSFGLFGILPLLYSLRLLPFIKQPEPTDVKING